MIPNLSLLTYPWIVLGVFWLIAAATKKPTVRSQPTRGRMVHVALALLGFLLLGHSWFHVGWLRMRFAPMTQGIFFAGFTLEMVGAVFAVWARLALGGNWSGRPSLMVGHELITSGPYAMARHPIYTGLILAVAGTALAIGEWRCLLGVLAIFLAFLMKIGEEEQMMMQAFPESYPGYRLRVKTLIPGVF